MGPRPRSSLRFGRDFQRQPPSGGRRPHVPYGGLIQFLELYRKKVFCRHVVRCGPRAAGSRAHLVDAHIEHLIDRGRAQLPTKHPGTYTQGAFLLLPGWPLLQEL
jgi:hypothetical protein